MFFDPQSLSVGRRVRVQRQPAAAPQEVSSFLVRTGSGPSPLRAEHAGRFTFFLQQILASVIRRLIRFVEMLCWLHIMKSTMTAKTITLRLSPEDYAGASALAKRKRLSLNKLFLTGMKCLDRQEQEKRLFDDFTLIGDQLELANVEFGLTAQSEVIDRP